MISQPWHYCHFGLDNPLLSWGYVPECLAACLIPTYQIPPLSCDYQNCLQTLLNIPQRGKPSLQSTTSVQEQMNIMDEEIGNIGNDIKAVLKKKEEILKLKNITSSIFKFFYCFINKTFWMDKQIGLKAKKKSIN